MFELLKNQLSMISVLGPFDATVAPESTPFTNKLPALTSQGSPVLSSWSFHAPSTVTTRMLPLAT